MRDLEELLDDDEVEWALIFRDEVPQNVRDALGRIVKRSNAVLEGEKVWWCGTHDMSGDGPTVCYIGVRQGSVECEMVERLLIPIPDPVTTE